MFLTGAGHFGFGFLLGSCLLLVLWVIFKRRLFVQLYAPFLPFLLGFIAAAPYGFLYKEQCDLPGFLNAFMFYSLVHCDHSLASILSSIHLVALLCGIVYAIIVIKYIVLVRSVRRGNISFD